MQTHEMRLHPNPFRLIREGSKTVEIRLNDEKRQQMEVGDKIEFYLRPEERDSFLSEVIGLDTFKDFEEAYASYSPKEYGGDTKDEWRGMYKYYSPEDEKKYGVVGIRLRVLD